MNALAEPTAADISEMGSQETIRLSLPLVEQNVDYQRMSTLLETMDEILSSSGVEQRFVNTFLERELAAHDGQLPSDRRLATITQHARRSLRCMIAMLLSGESYRTFSVHLADSYLLRRFCGYDRLDDDQSPSKSTIQRMAESVAESDLAEVIGALMATACGQGVTDDSGATLLGLESASDLQVVLADTTCIELDMHFPVDWVLLRDGVKSIIQSIIVIRKHGLKHRIGSPESFITQINKACINMTAASRQRGNKKARKASFRSLKAIAKTVIKHGKRYLKTLENNWEETALTEKQMAVIASRLHNTLDLMPTAIDQAHQRIIQETPLKNSDKLLSLFEPHASVYVRKKSGADCEFGLQCLIIENTDGLILDWSVSEEGVASDTSLLIPAMDRLIERYGKGTVGGVVTDRGFSSAKNTEELNQRNLADYTLPRSPAAMHEAMKDPVFAAYQKRRSQTESRIGIIKNKFIGGKLRAKGLKHQQTMLAWAALAHNVWILARMLIDQREQEDTDQQAA